MAADSVLHALRLAVLGWVANRRLAGELPGLLLSEVPPPRGGLLMSEELPRMSVHALRTSNSSNLRRLRGATVIEDENNDPLAIIFSYGAYLKLQDSLESALRAVKDAETRMMQEVIMGVLNKSVERLKQ
jgi:hypothetical protein